MKEKIEKSILKTLIYTDIFEYPLSKSQLWKFLTAEKIGREFFEKTLGNLPEKISFRDNFYFLSGRDKIIKTRIKRHKESQKKIATAKNIIKKLSFIPTIKFIGISGALSMENSERDDDIDLFVIASKGTVWMTRLAMIVFLLAQGKYRRRNQRQLSDKICLNMIIDESELSFSEERQDLYTAHEIVQIMPVFERNNMYSKFLIANEWVKKYLPNAFDYKRRTTRNHTQNYTESFFSVFLRNILHFSAFEKLAKTVQLWSIKRHITTETIKDGFLAFHPLDYKNKVLSEYTRRLREYGL